MCIYTIWFLAWLSICTAFDFRIRKIPNAWILSGYITAICFVLIQYRESDQVFLVLCSGTVRMLGSMVLLFPLFLIRAMGAGDIKILALVFAIQGIQEGGRSVFLALFIGGAAGMLQLILKKKLCSRVAYFFHYVRRICTCTWNVRREVYWDPDRDGTEMTMPFVWCIEMGVWLNMWMTGM